MPRPDCPRCGSDLVAAASSGAPSEHVLELRDGRAPAGVAESAVVHWLCRSCGHEWEPAPPDPELAPDVPTSRRSASNPAIALRRAREARGRTLSEVASGTRIQERHLRALETDAPLEEFPAPAYARFFLREYAEYLRLDPDPLLHEFEVRHPVVEEEPFEPLPVQRRRPKIVSGILVTLSVAAVILIAILPLGSDPQEDAFLEPSAPEVVAVHDSGHEQLTGPIGLPPSGVRAVLRLSGPSWVEAVADGEVLEASTLEPGDPFVYRADELLELTLGDAGAVRLRVNRELVPTGGSGDVVTLGLEWRDGELLIRRG